MRSVRGGCGVVLGGGLQGWSVAVGRFQDTVKFIDELLGGHFIHILGNQIKHKKVSELLEIIQTRIWQNVGNLVPANSAGAGLYHGSSDTGVEENSETVEEEDPRDGGDSDEPEPEEDVDLLVDDVQRQNTKTIMSLGGATRTKLVKTALGDLKRK